MSNYCEFDSESDEWSRHLHPGDEVTWTDPDDGACSITGVIQSIEYFGDDMARIIWTDGGELEVFLHELS